MSNKVAIILPSRGLMFSRTAQEIHANHMTNLSKFFFAHKLPIPQCFEEPTLRALDDPDITHLWYIEDDMAIPTIILRQMLLMDEDVVTADYPVTKEGKGAVFEVGGEVIYCGTGCLLVKREVFAKLAPPYFRSDIRWTPLNYGKTVKLVGSMFGDEGYGLHDVTFGVKLYQAGVKIHVFGTVGQRKLVALGKTGTNNGQHKIETWQKVKKDHQFKKIMSQPLANGAKGELITVDTPTGGLRVTRKHAKNLIKQGLATPINEKQIIIDDSEVKW